MLTPELPNVFACPREMGAGPSPHAQLGPSPFCELFVKTAFWVTVEIHFALNFRKSESETLKRSKMLIRSALKTTDPGASNGGSNFELRPLEADLVSFEVAMLPCHTREKGRIASSELENGPKCVRKLKTKSCQIPSEEAQDKYATPPWLS